MTEQRFRANGICRCERIISGECRQCSACDDCELFVANSAPITAYTHMWGGEIRDSLPHGARHYMSNNAE